MSQAAYDQYLNPESVIARKRMAQGLAASLGGQTPGIGAWAGAPPAAGTQPSFSYQPANVPGNSGFDSLAQNEFKQRNALGNQMYGDINNYASGYENTLKDRHQSLSNSLLDYGQKQFQQATPGLLEDLNSRGLLTSETGRNQAFGSALKDISLANENRLYDFDTQGYGHLDDIRDQALGARLGGQQGALDSALGLDKAKLQGELDRQATAEQQAYGEMLAKRQSRDSLTSSLIGSGGSILSGALIHGIGGGGAGSGLFSGLFGGGAGAAGAASPVGSALSLGGAAGSGGLGSAGAAGSTLGGGAAAGGGIGLGTVGLGALGYGAAAAGGSGAGQLLGKALYKSNSARTGARRGAQIGSLAGTAVLGPLGSLVGGAGGAVVGGAAQKAGKAIKKAFCFDAMTPVEMADGSEKFIKSIRLGDETKGGHVDSIRISETADGTRFNYRGVVVTGSHAVLDNGKWVRVENAPGAELIPGGGVVYSLVTSGHRIYSNGITLSDEHETDEDLSMDVSLAALNSELVEA